MPSLNGAVGPSSSLDNGEIQREPALSVRRIATGRANTVIAQPYGVKSAAVSIAPNDVNLPAMIDETDDLNAIPGTLSCGSLPIEAGHQTVWHVPGYLPVAGYMPSVGQMQFDGGATERRSSKGVGHMMRRARNLICDNIQAPREDIEWLRIKFKAAQLRTKLPAV